MVLGKLRDPKMRNLRQVIKTYNIKPAPIFVDFDQRREPITISAAASEELIV